MSDNMDTTDGSCNDYTTSTVTQNSWNEIAEEPDGDVRGWSQKISCLIDSRQIEQETEFCPSLTLSLCQFPLTDNLFILLAG